MCISIGPRGTLCTPRVLLQSPYVDAFTLFGMIPGRTLSRREVRSNKHPISQHGFIEVAPLNLLHVKPS